MYDGEDSDGPKGTFEIYKAEADTLYKQGEYRKSIESYTTALELQPNEKNTLVARSKCHLQLGDTSNALIDAEASLTDDKTFHKGVYQKAQALYYQGDFEMALVFYHRGHKLRPELQEFRLGIQKAQEAIDNSVGSPDKVQLTTEGDLSFFQKQDEKRLPKRGGGYGMGRSLTHAPVRKRKFDVNRSPGNEKTIKQLLGELYGDRQYLERLLKETDPKTNMGKTISNLVEEGLMYLDTRTDFWRQQKPMYARRHEKIMQKHRFESNTGKLSPNDYIIRELERIDQAQIEGKYQESLKKAQRCLSTVENFTEDQVPNKLEVIANLHSCIGNAYLEMGQFDKALEHHQIDYNMGDTHDLEEAKSRGLDNLGRVNARHGNYQKAIDVWEQKLPMSKSALESTWLYHEIGRCYLELNKFDKARNYGEKSLTAAEEADDPMWQLQATVLIAQSEVKLGDLSGALATFETSLDLARTQGDTSAETAIKKAIEEVNAKIAKGGSRGSGKSTDSGMKKTETKTDKELDMNSSSLERVDTKMEETKKEEEAEEKERIEQEKKEEERKEQERKEEEERKEKERIEKERIEKEKQEERKEQERKDKEEKEKADREKEEQKKETDEEDKGEEE
ncbi:tetratricopeptide repeat protein 25-like [Pecten maximus]|uniref:tetratricopeptide repeat protein 25-like n=1 Tax=Pecten maximus TaxID=6579 RepID=UPI0014585829|nr:tetratricopeptide repeat protein 25-like [Pecten maximus]